MKKNEMKCILFAALATTAVGTASARAADLPQRPVYTPALVMMPMMWTGCYIGLNAGAGWGNAQITNNNTGAGVSGTNTGFVGGGQMGCDYEFGGGFVIGARDMFDGTSLNSGTAYNDPIGFGSGTFNSKTSWFNTLTARIGYAVMPNALVYFQGGGAWTRTTQSITTSSGVQTGQIANSKGGYDVGGGVEYLFAPNWSVFAEYNYMNFGTNNGTAFGGFGSGCRANCSFSLTHNTQTLLAGVNWRFP